MSSETPFSVRRATEADAPALGRLGGMLLRAHHAFDPQRFIPPGSDPEGGYEWFLRTQLKEEDAAVFVAEQQGTVIGYVFAALEPISWKELRDACGFIPDVAVDDAGVGFDLADQPAVKGEGGHRRALDLHQVHRIGAEMRRQRDGLAPPFDHARADIGNLHEINL